jgi:hypothetical protein
MLPYLIEGLDCSGKKTVTRRVSEVLADQGVFVNPVIGPLVQGPLGRLDGYLANITRPVSPNSLLGRFRRLSFAAGPVVDGLFYQLTYRHDVKISSHYRAWAYARVEGDRLVDRAFSSTRRFHPVFAGATLLYAEFDTRLQRHRGDVEGGRTGKREEVRFFGPGLDQDTFEAWHTDLDALMGRHIPQVQRLNSTGGDIDVLAEKVAQHVLTCWGKDQ